MFGLADLSPGDARLAAAALRDGGEHRERDAPVAQGEEWGLRVGESLQPSTFNLLTARSEGNG